MATLKKTKIGFQDQLLAHLSRGLMGELIVYQSLVVRSHSQTSLKPLGQLIGALLKFKFSKKLTSSS